MLEVTSVGIYITAYEILYILNAAYGPEVGQ